MFALGGATVLLSGAAAGLFVLGRGAGRARSVLDSERKRLRHELHFLRARWTEGQVLGAMGLGAAGGLGVAWTLNPWAGLGVLFVSALTPRQALARARRRRVLSLEGQLESWLTALASALSATPSLGEALESSQRLMDAPLRDELAQILDEHRLGSPLDRALDSAAARVKSRTFSCVLTTLRIARNTGGDLTALLLRTSANLREMTRLEGVVRARTAEGKAQATVISITPAPLFFGLRAINPEFFRPLETTVVGHLIVAAAAGLWIAAALLARRILAVNV